MKRYRFTIEYNGQNFAGWQRQPEQRTVQEELEKVMSQILQEKVTVFGSGRTDAGVHARGQVAQVDFSRELPLNKLEKGMNALLESDVCVRDFAEVSSEFSARYDARSRYYIYRVATRKITLGADHAWIYPRFSLDLSAMRIAAQSFLGEHDFKDFCIPRNDDKSTLCTLTKVEIKEAAPLLEFHIEGNRFLHRMVRAMVGTLTEIGRGFHPPSIVKDSLEGKCQAPRLWAPCQGLCLEKVRYEGE